MSNIYFNFVLADNDVDYDREAFTIGALADIRRLCIGHYGIFDCTTYKAKVIEAHLMQSCDNTKDGRTKYYIYATAEMPNNEDTRKIISKIESDKPKASISCCVRHMCTDNGVLWISAITDFYEFSIKFDREYESDMLVKELEKQLEVVERHNDDLLKRIEDLTKQLEVRKGEQYIPDYPEFKPSQEQSWYMNVSLQSVGPVQNSGTQDDYNVFHTKEYAQEFAKKCKLIAMMLHCKWYLDRDYVPNWEDQDEIKWDVHFDCNSNKFVFESWRHKMASGVYFSSDAAARKCADWLNEHWKESGDEYNS